MLARRTNDDNGKANRMNCFVVDCNFSDIVNNNCRMVPTTILNNESGCNKKKERKNTAHWRIEQKKHERIC